MKKTFTILIAAIAAILMMAQPAKVWGQTRTTTYEQLTSIANIDESAQYVLGIDGTGFHYDGTSSWGKTALPSSQTPYYYTLKKHDNGASFTAYTTISNTNYYLLVPGTNTTGSNTFSMQTSDPTTNDDKGNIIIGTAYVTSTNYAVTSREYNKRHLRNNGTSGLRAYAGNTGDMAYFYKVKYTVNYNCNGGDSGCPTTTINNVPSGNYTLAAAPTRENYTFEGWSDGTNIYAAGATYLLNADNKTFTAQWTLNSSSPTTTVSPASLSDFSCVQNSGNASASQSFAVSGANLDANITVTIAANSDFEMSAQDGENWSSTTSITLNKDGNNAVAETNIYVRMKASTTYGDKSGSISITSTNATDKSVSLSGNVIQAKTINWHHGAGGTSTATTDTYVGATLAELPTAATVNGWTFIGWVASYSSGYPVTVTAPLTVTAGMSDFYAVYRHGNNVIYQLTTSTSDLSAGTRYMMGYYSNGYLLMTTNFAGTSAVSLDASNQYTYTAGTQWTLGGSNNSWTFTDANGKLLSSQSTTNSSASLKLETTATDYSYWSISYDDASPKHSKIQNNGNVSNNSKNLKISYYSSTFNCYDNAVVYLFKEVTEYSIEPTVEKCYFTYDANGATNGDVPSDGTGYDPGTSVTVIGNSGSLGKTGYSWAGWCLNAEGTGTVYGPTYTTSYTINANTTFYAKWNINSYTYTLDDSDEHVAAGLEVGGESYTASTIPYNTEVEVVVDTDDGYGYTISVKDADDNDVTLTNNTFNMPASMVTITVTSRLLMKYVLVTSDNQLVAGKHYVIASGTSGNNVEGIGYQKQNNRDAVDVGFDNGKLVENDLLWDFVLGGDATNGWTFYDKYTDGEGFLRAPTSNNNYLTLNATTANYTRWSISIASSSDNYKASVVAKGGNRKNMRYNSSSSLFACYANSDDQYDIYLFVKDDDTDYEIYSASPITGTHTLTSLFVNGKLTIKNNAVITVSGELTNSTAKADSLVIEDGGQLKFTSTGAKADVKATVQKNITGYGTDDNTGWNFIASPISGNIAPEDVTNLLGEQIQTTPSVLYNYDLYRLNPAEPDNKGWENYHQHNDNSDPFMLTNGQGYLYAKSSTTTLEFAGTIKPYDGSANTVSLAEGWNLVGNPYTFNVFSSKSYYTITTVDGKNKVTPVEGSSSAITPCTGIVVKSADASNVAFMETAGEWATGNNGNLQITLAQTIATRGVSNVETIDNAIVSFNEGTELEKFYFGNPSANIYIPQDNEEYAIVSAEAQGEMPVNFVAAEDGEYTINVNPENVEMNYLHLIDNKTGNDVDLLVNPSYTFSAKTTDYASRFRLVFVANENHNENENENFAFISNGQIIVNGTGTIQIIDIMGRVISTRSTEERISTSGMTAGVYVLQLITGSETKTQKIVIR